MVPPRHAGDRKTSPWQRSRSHLIPTTSDVLASSNSHPHHPLLVTVRQGQDNFNSKWCNLSLFITTSRCSKIHLWFRKYVKVKMIGELSLWFVVFHVLSISNSRQAHYMDPGPGVSVSQFDKSLLNNILSHPSGDTQQYKWSDTLSFVQLQTLYNFPRTLLYFKTWEIDNVCFFFSSKNCKAHIKYNLKTLEDFSYNLVLVTLVSFNFIKIYNFLNPVLVSQ